MNRVGTPVKIRWKLLFSIACLFLLAACDTTTTLSEVPSEEEQEEVPPAKGKILPLRPSTQWVYDVKQSIRELTIAATGGTDTVRGEEYDILAFRVKQDDQAWYEYIRVRETEEGLYLMDVGTEFYFKYPIELKDGKASYTYSDWHTRVEKETITVPAGSFECLRYIHNRPPELVIWQYCLVPGIGFVEYHYGTHLSQLVSYNSGAD